MKIALIQFDTLWEDKEANLDYVSNQIKLLPQDVDLVILPEMFTTGFSMIPERSAELENGPTFQTLQQLAVNNKVAITASWITEDEEQYYNRLYFIYPDGSYETYNKRHLFTLAGEQNVYEPGTDKLIVSYKGWNICPLICYDLRFPVYSRIVDENYDLLIYVASWPERRIYAWDSLLKARAIENMSYVVAVNRCGSDPSGVNYSGHSQVLDPLGHYIIEPITGSSTPIIELNKNTLSEARLKFNFLKDSDAFELK